MKIIKFILPIAAFGILASSCSDIDLEAKGIVDEGMLFSSDYGIRKYFAGIYDQLPIEDFTYCEANESGRGYSFDNANHNTWHWDAAKGSSCTVAGETFGRGGSYGDSWHYWPYGNIRRVNTFLQNFKYENVSNSFSIEEYNNYLGEAHFLRAYLYFGMVKRYGGVPLVKEVLDPTLSDEELQIGRSTEYDSWMFIHDDLQFAIENMNADNGRGRANKYVAAALMSRAMLYAGSNARYNKYYSVTGQATNQGLMLMEGDNLAEQFFKYAYDACEIVSQGGYALHTGANKAEAFAQVFIEDTKEDIFVKQFGEGYVITPQQTGLIQSWDITVLPKAEGLANDVGCMITPTWDLIDMYEHPAIVDENGYPVRFDKREDFWQSPETEPRLVGSIYFSGMSVAPQNVVLDFQSGLFQTLTASAADIESDNWDELMAKPFMADNNLTRVGQPGGQVNAQGFKINGLHGACMGAGDEGYAWTSSVIRKYVNYKAPQEQRSIFMGQQDWKTFRYGEVVCNWMEAAYELYELTSDGKYFAKAQECLNALRDRAGATPHTLAANGGEDVGTELYGHPITENMQYIRDERARELAFENHRTYDLRRWRIMDEMFQNYLPKQMATYLIQSEGKYVFITEPGTFGRRITFNSRDYYEAVPMDGNNPNIIQNDRY